MLKATRDYSQEKPININRNVNENIYGVQIPREESGSTWNEESDLNVQDKNRNKN
jgi:hypothetical protein